MSAAEVFESPPGRRAEVLTADEARGIISDHLSAGLALAFVMEVRTRRHLYLQGDFQRLLGVTAEDLRANPDAWHAALDPVDLVQLQDVRSDLLLGRRVERTFTARGGDGRRRILHAVLSLRESPSGTVSVGTVTEVRGIEGMTGAVNPFRLLVESGEVGLAVTDGSGSFRYLNQELVELFRFGCRDDLLGRGWVELCGDIAARELEATAFRGIAASGGWEGVVQMRRRDGSLFHAALALSRLPGGHLVWKCRDCTREVETFEKLRRTESLLVELLDELPLGLILQDADGRVEFANRTLRKWLGAGTGPATSAEIEIILRSDPVFGAWAVANRQLTEDETAIFDFPADVPASGRRIWEVQKFRLHSTARVTDLTCTLVADVSALREADRNAGTAARQRDEYFSMQREFVAMVSHEFRTPLSAIQGVHYLLERATARLAPEQQPPFARHLELQGKALGNFKALVDEVLLLNQLEHAAGPPNLEPADVGLLLRQTADTFNNSLPGARVELRVPGDPVKAKINLAQIRALADNLVSNALKYSEVDTSVTVTLSADEQFWRLEVRDRGRGIPEADQRRLFEPFFRASNVAMVQGTGLGLAIVRRIVAAHGGTLGFESAVGVGTTFAVSIPLEPADASPARPLAPWSRSPLP